MKKLTLNVEDLRVTSFDTEEATAAEAAALISGRLCPSKPTAHDTCCTG